MINLEKHKEIYSQIESFLAIVDQVRLFHTEIHDLEQVRASLKTSHAIRIETITSEDDTIAEVVIYPIGFDDFNLNKLIDELILCRGYLANKFSNALSTINQLEKEPVTENESR